MSMTKKDYELIASTINDELTAFNDLHVHSSHQVKLLVNGIAIALGKSNPKFDRAKFLEACGIEKPWCKKCGVWHHGEHINFK